MIRSTLLVILALLAPAGGHTTDIVSNGTDDNTRQSITVYRTPDCSCCHRWIEHLRDHGFRVDDQLTNRLPGLKRELGVPENLASCHTAVVADYVIEGHVPAMDIRRLLRDRPGIHGLSVPGMPVGSPGMESGDRQDAYHVMEFDSRGYSKSYNYYPGQTNTR